ncbi:hypothetical protein [Pseudacidovorax intermedius]|mgnify:CR=1 FL=1|uniref:hypothetical protein n=1 Tax=Pseudacidovorax intermedius TaxID=433924 RepID=UPI0026F0C088|nr:hypothetical protein [Pseudacidovorax intermedius]
MKTKTTLRQFERDIQGMAGNVTLYRRGINDFYLSHGFPRIYEELEAVRSRLEAIGMYVRCRGTLQQAEALVRQGPDHDEEAQLLLLNLGGDLKDASGTHARMRKKLRENPNATIDDFKADPDEESDQQ